jgi:ribosome-associated protein
VQTTTALSEEQKQRVMQKLTSQLTSEGDLIIHSSASRSQEQNKRAALEQLADIIRKALHVPKKRIATRASKAAVENRLHTKSRRADIKKMLSKPIRYD